MPDFFATRCVEPRGSRLRAANRDMKVRIERELRVYLSGRRHGGHTCPNRDTTGSDRPDTARQNPGSNMGSHGVGQHPLQEAPWSDKVTKD